MIIREKKDVLVLPERLVTFEDGGKKTFVELPGADPKAEPKKVEIKTGISDGLNVEIVSRAEEGRQGRGAAAEGDLVDAVAESLSR